jgi:hypothetical protein
MLALLNFELSAYEECTACRFIAVKPAQADTAGCNWRDAAVKYDGEPTETARRIAQRVLDEVRDKYNVA